MQVRPWALAALTALSIAGGPALAREHARPRNHRHVRLPADYRAWSRVAVCESGGWRVLGSAYPDSLGITAANFAAFDGRAQPPGGTSIAERVAQIRVADRLIRHYGISIPDQSGCEGSW